MTRSRHSRRIDPMTRSAKGFCQGARGAMRTPWIPMPFTRRAKHIAVDGVPITEQVLGCGLFREALDKLLGGPGGGWMVGDVDMDEFPTVVAKDQEPEEQAEGEGGDDEEVDSDDVTEMRLKEGAPRGGWPRRGAPHGLGNGEPSDLIAEELEFSLDPTLGQGRVHSSEAATQRSEFTCDRRW